MTGPTPQSISTRNGWRNASSPPGGTSKQAVGFGDVAGDLGQEFGAGHADADGQPYAFLDRLSQSRGDVDGGASGPPQPADLEKRLVDRETLHQGRGVVEDIEHGPAGLDVGVHAGFDHHRRRAQATGLDAVHGGADTARLGFVTGGHDYAAADDDRATAQLRSVALLDRRVERVEVGVQDGGLIAHSNS